MSYLSLKGDGRNKTETQPTENRIHEICQESFTNVVKNLGCTCDSGNTFAIQITKVYHAGYYHLKDCISKILSGETAVLLASSMISSRIDN